MNDCASQLLLNDLANWLPNTCTIYQSRQDNISPAHYTLLVPSTILCGRSAPKAEFYYIFVHEKHLGFPDDSMRLSQLENNMVKAYTKFEHNCMGTQDCWILEIKFIVFFMWLTHLAFCKVLQLNFWIAITDSILDTFPKIWTVYLPICILLFWYIIYLIIVLLQIHVFGFWGDFCE